MTRCTKDNSPGIHQTVIRRARLSDAAQIADLLQHLGYPVSTDLVQCQLAALLRDRNEDLLVAEAGETRVKAEREACRLAVKRGCDRIELHCHARRTNAHGFYARLGYTESPKYFVKSLRG